MGAVIPITPPAMRGIRRPRRLLIPRKRGRPVVVVLVASTTHALGVVGMPSSAAPLTMLVLGMPLRDIRQRGDVLVQLSMSTQLHDDAIREVVREVTLLVVELVQVRLSSGDGTGGMRHRLMAGDKGIDPRLRDFVGNEDALARTGHISTMSGVHRALVVTLVATAISTAKSPLATVKLRVLPVRLDRPLPLALLTARLDRRVALGSSVEGIDRLVVAALGAVRTGPAFDAVDDLRNSVVGVGSLHVGNPTGSTLTTDDGNPRMRPR